MKDATTRNIVITGATHGMGKEAAEKLAHQGARLLLVGRNRELCESVRNELVAKTGNQNIDYLAADLSSVGEVRRAAAEIRRRFDRIDTLVNNAGGTFPAQRTETAEGLEIAFALQYLQRFVLTEELIEQLQTSDDPVVMVNAGGGTHAKDIDLDDLQCTRGYSKFGIIGRTAALNELFTQELMKRHPGVSAINYGPGLVRTNTTMETTMARIFFQSIGRLFTRSPADAGADIANLAAGGHGSGFYGPRLKKNVPAWSQRNAEAGPVLWRKTEELLSQLNSGRKHQVA